MPRSSVSGQSMAHRPSKPILVRKRTESMRSLPHDGHEYRDQSALTTHTGAPQVKLLVENTYKLEPDEKFQPRRVEILMEAILREKFKDAEYSLTESRHKCTTLAEEIKSRVKSLGYHRYKLICMVNIGSRNRQGLVFASRSVWDQNFDGFASASFKNSSMFCTAILFAVYYE